MLLVIVLSYGNFLITVVNSTVLTFKLHSLLKQQMKTPHDQMDGIVETCADLVPEEPGTGRAKKMQKQGSKARQNVFVSGTLWLWQMACVFALPLYLCLKSIHIFGGHPGLCWAPVFYYLVATPGMEAHTIFSLLTVTLIIRQWLLSYREGFR